ncbi:MAG: hypothetical protein HC913_15260 [Microscillaceae bacterium]|nr:hypothetical protein [Microscillaceae bacterium]
MTICTSFFYANLDGSVFDTLEVGIYDEDRLVAVSFFDQGRRSLASILGLYDQDYEKYSLGTYTLLTEMAYGLDTGRKFYYPGYVLDRPSVFDYKLQLANGQMQYYDWKGKWKPYERLGLERFTVHVLREKMLALQQALGQERTAFRKILYPMFSVGYLAFMGDQFIKSPMFLAHSPQTRRPFYLVIEFLIEEETYRLSWVSPCPEYQEFLNMHISEDLLDEKLYHMDLLRTDEVIYEHASAVKITEEALRLI